jgi:hypothetical protein
MPAAGRAHARRAGVQASRCGAVRVPAGAHGWNISRWWPGLLPVVWPVRRPVRGVPGTPLPPGVVRVDGTLLGPEATGPPRPCGVRGGLSVSRFPGRSGPFRVCGAAGCHGVVV